MFLYHYTDEEGLSAIIRDGSIQPAAMEVTKDLLPTPTSEWLSIGPVVWLTINPILDGTVLIKLCGGDTKNLCRITLPYICDVGLTDFCRSEKIPTEWFDCMVYTGGIVGSDYTTWRLCSVPIKDSSFLNVETGGSWLRDTIDMDQKT